ncbi:hypothetical protein HZ994_07770 [Akkermansiaceae bacterium]|nr:hypothetical protein HZ994_07770 [Akkermansiaceae bacterium]
MSGNEPTIEAEVVEIDGIAVEPKPVREESAKGAPWARWGNWQGQVKRLDARWWPLWIVLGSIALVLIVAVGMVAVVLFVAFRMFVGLVNGIARLFFPSQGLGRR